MEEELEKEGKIMYVSLAERVYTEKGIEIGKLEGKQEMALETVRSMKALGLSRDVIIKVTGLPEAEINRLN